MSAIPEVDVDLSTPDAIADPVPLLRTMQDAGPLVLNRGYPGGLLVTRFKECQRVLGNVRWFKIDSGFFEDRFGHSVFEDDDTPRHDRIRGVWAESFTRESLDRFRRPAFRALVSARIASLVARLADGDDVDVVREITLALPELAIAPMLGIADARHDDFVASARAMSQWYLAETDPARADEIRAIANAGTRDLMAHVERGLAERGDGTGSDDLFSLMLRSTVAREEMSHAELVATCGMLVFAAGNSTSNLTASVIVTLAREHEERGRVRRDRSLIPGAIEEVARLSAPVQVGIARRTIHPDAEVGGHPLPLDSTLLPMIGIANRDPRRWTDPDRFDPTRERLAHLGFGFGMHSCLGMNFARILLEELVDVLLDELPDWTMLEVDYGTNFKSWGPRRAILQGLAR